MRRFALLLALICLLTACARPVEETQPTQSVEVTWEVGNISTKNGENRSAELGKGLRTASFLRLSDHGGFLPAPDLVINWFAYDGEKQYLGSGLTVMGSGVGISSEEILQKEPKTVFVRLILRSAYNDGTVAVEDAQRLDLLTHQPWPGVPFKQEEVANLSAFQKKGIQDGEALGDRLFLFNDEGLCNVYDANTGAFLDDFLLGGREYITPHVNSASFSDQYYEEGDRYPLLYASVYNNLTPQNTQILGFCCVYRITESDGQFSSELVQLLWVSFVGDRELWMSPVSNERPFGNFVVDTDRDMLYAFVPRDDSRTTRFFGFALPDPEAGNYSNTYGCPLLYLNAEDIRQQFDVEYFSSPQGCTYGDGKIYSVEGFGSTNTVPPFLRVVDVESETLELSFNLGQLGLGHEPETITFRNGELLYVSTDRFLRKLIYTK